MQRILHCIIHILHFIKNYLPEGFWEPTARYVGEQSSRYLSRIYVYNLQDVNTWTETKGDKL